jgi:hypothetical protein
MTQSGNFWIHPRTSRFRPLIVCAVFLCIFYTYSSDVSCNITSQMEINGFILFLVSFLFWTFSGHGGKYKCTPILQRNLGSLVGLDDQGSISFSSPPSSDQLSGYRGLFLRRQSDLSVKLTIYLHLVPRLIMRGHVLPLSRYLFMAWYLVKHRYDYLFQSFKQVRLLELRNRQEQYPISFPILPSHHT